MAQINKMHCDDPMEMIVGNALLAAKIDFYHESMNKGQKLDFLLPLSGVYIECKQFPTERTGQQIAEIANVIVIQGRAAAAYFAALLGATDAPTAGG